MKPLMALLGGGLIVLGLLGIAPVPWLGWIDVALGIAAMLAGSMLEGASASMRSGVPVAIGVAAIVVFLVAIGVGATTWLAWWTFAFGIAFFVVSAAGAPSDRPRI
jgi:hypothetical protein